jgi:hypothetical protein
VSRGNRDALVAELCQMVAREMAARAQQEQRGPSQARQQGPGPGPGQQQPKAQQPAAGASQQDAPGAQQGPGPSKRSWAAAVGAGGPGGPLPGAVSPPSHQRRPAGPSSPAAPPAAPAAPAAQGGAVQPCGPLLRGQPHTLVLGHSASPQGEPGALLLHPPRLHLGMHRRWRRRPLAGAPLQPVPRPLGPGPCLLQTHACRQRVL